jgi:hypothetical protein
MITYEEARQMAMSLPGTEEKDHFGIPSFRVNNGIYSTLWTHENKMMVKLSPIDQSVFSSFNKDIIYPVPNKWGLHGCTLFELATVPPEMLQDALKTAWETRKAKKKSEWFDGLIK